MIFYKNRASFAWHPQSPRANPFLRLCDSRLLPKIKFFVFLGNRNLFAETFFVTREIAWSLELGAWSRERVLRLGRLTSLLSVVREP